MITCHQRSVSLALAPIALVASVFSGAAQAAQAAQAGGDPTYNKSLAKQAIYVQLDPQSADPVMLGVTNEIIKTCSVTFEKQFAFALTPEFSSQATGVPLDDYATGKSGPEWLAVDCDRKEAWRGPRDVVDAKVAQMEQRAKSSRVVNEDSSTVIHGGGVVIMGPDGTPMIREDNHQVIHGSENPGLSEP